MRGEIEVVSAALTFYRIPTESFGEVSAESDGTARWGSTGMLVVELSAAGEVGLGYSYTTGAAAEVGRELLVPAVIGGHPFDTVRAFWAMATTVRNQGWPGVCASAISAFDLALHDLKARLLGTSLTQLLGGARASVTAYGSGGFTSYSVAQLQEQLAVWAADGMRAVKMKIGTHPEDDLARVVAAREAIGPSVDLYVDANGAYERKQALAFAHQFADLGVTWFEEPVSSDDLDGLRLLRDRAPAGMRIAAGEYGYTPAYFHAMLSAGAVDVIQADSTRCGGATGFLIAAAQAQGAAIPLSAHTAPAVHASIGAALPNVINVEYFHDHARIESLFFDGAPRPENGELTPDRDRHGTGLTLKKGDVDRYLTSEWHSS